MGMGLVPLTALIEAAESLALSNVIGHGKVYCTRNLG